MPPPITAPVLVTDSPKEVVVPKLPAPCPVDLAPPIPVLKP